MLLDIGENMEENIVLTKHMSEEGGREATVKKRPDGKYLVVFHDNWDGVSFAKVYSHLQLAEDQAEDWVL